MARINKAPKTPKVTTYEGGRGYKRPAKSELFLLGGTQFHGEDTFYESADERNTRFVDLTHKVAVQDPAWSWEFVRWLRYEANIRTAAVVAGIEGAKALADAGRVQFGEADYAHAGQGLVRRLTKAGIRRPDEVGEGLAYYMKTYGGDPGGGIKRGLADKATELYNERNLLRYDTDAHAFRFGDVIELVHPAPKAPWQSDLFRYAIERRHNRANGIPESLAMVYRNSLLREEALGILGEARPEILLNPNNLREAGMTWEDVLSLVGNQVPKRELWEALIPSMGYMALLRNLRNFEQAGVSDDLLAMVALRLADPNEVAKSRQLPMRFLSAHRNVSGKWTSTLERALSYSVQNVPVLPGRTLILVDTSGSMQARMSDRSDLLRWDAAALFGLALAQRSERVDVVSFATRTRAFVAFPSSADTGVLQLLNVWQRTGFNLSGGTQTVAAVRERYQNHDRVVILTDEQVWPDDFNHTVNSSVPANVPVHTINLAGYQHGHTSESQQNRFTYTGLTDGHFKMIPLMEAGESQRWPWEVTQAPAEVE